MVTIGHTQDKTQDCASSCTLDRWLAVQSGRSGPRTLDRRGPMIPFRSEGNAFILSIPVSYLMRAISFSRAVMILDFGDMFIT